MINFIVNRILSSIPVIIGVISLSFIFIYIIPGDPVRTMVGDYYNDQLKLSDFNGDFNGVGYMVTLLLIQATW